MNDLLQLSVEAHGGLERWSRLTNVKASLSVTGNLWQLDIREIAFGSHGDPFDVLEVVDVPEPKAPGVNEALIGIEIAALTKYDLLSK